MQTHGFDIPGGEKYLKAHSIVVGYLSEKEFDLFFKDYSFMSFSKENSLLIERLRCCGYTDSEINLSYKGVMTNKQNHLGAESKYLSSIGKVDYFKYRLLRLYNEFHTIEPNELTEDKDFKITIISYSSDNFNFMKYSFNNGLMVKWYKLFYIVQMPIYTHV